MGLRDTEILDKQTGEIMDGYPVWVGRKRPNPYGERWFMSNQDAWLAMAKDSDLTLVPHRVLMYLFGRLDFENFIRIPQKEIADALGLDKSRVSHAITLLLNKHILFRGDKVGRSYGFRLNPDYGYKGDVRYLRRDMRGHLQIVRSKDTSRQTPDMFASLTER